MSQWVKQLTRENTLLDRSFRTIAYHQSLREIGKASISRSPIVGFGRVTSLYYDPVDYKKQQKIILREFRGKRITVMSRAIVRFLEDGYTWARSIEKKKMNHIEFLSCIRTFMRHHAHSRGAIVYGYWGEPVITAALRTRLARKVSREKLDATISQLSVPMSVYGILTQLYHSSPRLIVRRQALTKKLKLTGRDKELITILSWFTFFYELGERVSSFMYSVLLQQLRYQTKSIREFDELQWYDPGSLLQYFAGRRLSREEIVRRKTCYILRMKNGRLDVASGEKAKKLYTKEFEEKGIAATNEIKGTVACQGKAQGIVRIIVTKADQKKMRKGDILISPMTTPQLMSAIKKAGAIVTDEGGMTAHAAIVSRELNIPCIVGTRVATKVFKDGDHVEVDANHGIVRRIR